MNSLNEVGKILAILGAGIMLLGFYFWFGGKLFNLGKLPGDFSWKGNNFSFHFPLASSILISIAVSLLFYFIRKFL